MRIVHIADSFAPDVGGIENQVQALATRQTAEGHDVTVITAVGDDADLPLDVRRGLRTRWLTVAFPWLNHRMVAEVLGGRPVDVVHAHFTVISPLAIYGVRAASKRGIPVAVTVHSVWWKVAIATRLSTVVFFGPSRIRAVYSGVSSMIARNVARTLPRADEVLVVPNLVDVQWWAPTGPMRPTARDGLRLVLVGRLKKRKHIEEFIDVLGRARAIVPPDSRVQVDIIGEGPRREDLRGQIDRLGLSDWITLVGHRDPAQIRDLLHEADLFVAPSRQEAFGIAALEARGAGLPVLAYNYTGVSDFIEHGVEGLLVDDADAMISTLANVINDPSHLDSLRCSTRARRPSITMADALDATDRLYRHAQRMAPGG